MQFQSVYYFSLFSEKNASVEVHLGGSNVRQVNLALGHKIPLLLVSGSGGTTDEVIGKINMAKGKAGIAGNEDRNDAEVHKRMLLALAKVGYEVDLHSIAGKNSALTTLDRIGIYDYEMESFGDAVFRIVIINLILNNNKKP